MATHPVLICTHCGRDLQKEFEKNGNKSSCISCVKCGNTKNIIESMSEDERHSSFHLVGKDPVVFRF